MNNGGLCFFKLTQTVCLINGLSFWMKIQTQYNIVSHTTTDVLNRRYIKHCYTIEEVIKMADSEPLCKKAADQIPSLQYSLIWYRSVLSINGKINFKKKYN